jgi:hypothetical protein
MGRQHLLDLAGREPVGGDIDDVVGTGHHVDIPVGIAHIGRCSKTQRFGFVRASAIAASSKGLQGTIWLTSMP